MQEMQEMQENQENQDKELKMEDLPEDVQALLIKRQKIADKVDSAKFSDAMLTMVQRAEIHAILKQTDMYITTVENGIAYFTEEEYEKLVESTILDLRKFLSVKDLTESQIEDEVDSYAANLVIHYIDHKSFSDDEVQEVQDKFKEK